MLPYQQISDKADRKVPHYKHRTAQTNDMEAVPSCLNLKIIIFIKFNKNISKECSTEKICNIYANFPVSDIVEVYFKTALLKWWLTQLSSIMLTE